MRKIHLATIPGTVIIGHVDISFQVKNTVKGTNTGVHSQLLVELFTTTYKVLYYYKILIQLCYQINTFSLNQKANTFRHHIISAIAEIVFYDTQYLILPLCPAVSKTSMFYKNQEN